MSQRYRLGDIVHAKNQVLAQRHAISPSSNRHVYPVCCGRASRFADEVLIRGSCEQRQTDIRDLSQP